MDGTETMSKRRDVKSTKRAGPVKVGMPSKADILKFVADAPETVGKREIARAFGLKGSDRIPLKALLQEMAHDGTLSGNRKRLIEPGRLPATAVFEIVARDPDGDLIAEPVDWNLADGVRPRVLVKPRREAG
jgi:ribonuclease R